MRTLIESSKNLKLAVTFHPLQDGIISLGDQHFSATALDGCSMDPLLIRILVTKYFDLFVVDLISRIQCFVSLVDRF